VKEIVPAIIGGDEAIAAVPDHVLDPPAQARPAAVLGRRQAVLLGPERSAPPPAFDAADHLDAVMGLSRSVPGGRLSLMVMM
jgi:hypothetical protein